MRRSEGSGAVWETVLFFGERWTPYYHRRLQKPKEENIGLDTKRRRQLFPRLGSAVKGEWIDVRVTVTESGPGNISRARFL